MLGLIIIVGEDWSAVMSFSIFARAERQGAQPAIFLLKAFT
jgi:hypothetical protein